MSELTHVLERLHAGEPDAAHELFEHVYGELHHLARRQLQSDDFTGALSPTELVHETYLRLFRNEKPSFADRNYFFAAAAQAMRRVRVDFYRATRAKKRGGDQRRVILDPDLAASSSEDIDLQALDEALVLLEQTDPDTARLVELRFFAGLTMPRVAEVLEISLATAERHWKYAKAWLLSELQK